MFFQFEVVYNHDYKLRFDYHRFLYNLSPMSADLSMSIESSARTVCSLSYNKDFVPPLMNSETAILSGMMHSCQRNTLLFNLVARTFDPF